MRSKFLSVCALALFGCGAFAQEPAAPKIKAKPYSLVRLKADNLDAKAAVIWRVNPRQNVSRATNPRGVFEFTAPPGNYMVERLTIRTDAEGAIQVEEWFQEVEIERGCEQVPPANPPVNPPAPMPKADAFNALGRIQFGNAGCTATVVWPRRADGRWDILTAEHCVQHVAVGTRGAMQLRGRTERFNVKVVAKDSRSDVAWLVTESADLGDLPFALLANGNAPAGVKVWHAGFGVDVPGNREDGEVTRADSGTGKAEMVLSVSSGDSGGGIFRTDTGELISTVCCTTRKGARVTMYGGNVESIRRLRPRDATAAPAEADWWKPIDIPVADPHTAPAIQEWWKPLPVRECRTGPPAVIDLRKK
jgi:hypothetical protein